MSTTTIRLSKDLKARIERAAALRNTSAHHFIVQAIAEKTEQDERRSEFADEAELRYANVIATGRVISWGEMRDYLEARIAGKAVKPPNPRKLAR